METLTGLTWIEFGFCVAAILAYGIYYYFCENFALFRRQRIPGPKPIPIFGTWFNSWKKNTHEIALENYEKYGSIYCTFHGKTPVLHIQDRTIVHSILIKDSFEHFGQRTRRPVSGKDDNVNKTLALLYGEQAKVLRNVLIASISPQTVKQRFDFANESIVEFMKYLNTEKIQVGKIDLRVESEMLLEEVMLNYLVGRKLGTIGNPNHSFTINARKTIEGGQRSFLWTLAQLYPKLNRWLCHVSDTGNDYFVNLSKEMLEERSNSKQENGNCPDLLDKLLDCLNGNDEKGAKYIDSAIVIAQITSILLAGYDLGTVVTRVLHCLTINQSEQEKCREEIRESLLKSNSVGEITFSMLSELPYLDQCIREALRFYPTIFMYVYALSFKPFEVQGTCTKDKKYDQIFIPKGTAIEIPIYIMQRDPTIYNEPNKFLPERFALAETGKIDNIAFLPFGQGPRNCFAQKYAMLLLKHCLAHLLASYEFFPIPETKDSMSFITGPNGIVIAKDVWVGFKQITFFENL